jgi:hypothetical protein
MKKENLIIGGMVAVAIVGVGYMYGDKVANKFGINISKPKAQVEETVKEDKPTKPVESSAPKADENVLTQQDLDSFLQREVTFKTSKRPHTRLQVLKKIFGSSLKYYVKKDTIVVEGVYKLGSSNEPNMVYVFKKDNPMYYPIKYIEIPEKKKTMGTTEAEKFWLEERLQRGCYALEHSDNY